MSRHLLTAYTVSVVSFLLLLYIDWQVPGFVSSAFPIYLPLLVALIIGIILLARGERVATRKARIMAGALAVGLLLSLVLLPELQPVGYWQFSLALAMMLLPVLVVNYISYDK